MTDIYEWNDDESWEYNADELDWVIDYLKDKWDGEEIIVDATLGLWSGYHHGSYVTYDIQDVFDKFCPSIVEVIRGRVFLTHIHHDGRNTYELRSLTKKGRAWADNNCYGRMEQCEGNHIANVKGYTRRFINSKA